MKPQDISASFKEFDIDVAVQELLSPTVTSIIPLYTKIVSHALGYNINGIVQFHFSEANFFSDADMFDIFGHRAKIFLYLKVLSDTVNFDFTVNDFMRPESERLMKFLSSILQFMRHKQVKLNLCREINISLQQCSQAFENAQIEKAQKEAIRLQKENEAKIVRSRITELRYAGEEKIVHLRSLQEQQRVLHNKERDAQNTLGEVRKRTEQLHRDAETLRQRIATTQSKIASDPSALLRERARLQEEKENALKRIQSAQFEHAITTSRKDIIGKSLRKLAKRAEMVQGCRVLIDAFSKQALDQKELVMNAEKAAQKLQHLSEEIDTYSRTIEASKRNYNSLDNIYADRINSLQNQLVELEKSSLEREPERVAILNKIQDYVIQRNSMESKIVTIEEDVKRKIIEMEHEQTRQYDLVESIAKRLSNQMLPTEFPQTSY